MFLDVKVNIGTLDQTITKDFILSEKPETSALLHFLMQLDILHKPTEKNPGNFVPKMRNLYFFENLHIKCSIRANYLVC